MKNQTQLLTFALAVSFVTALALAVALICVFFVRDEEPPNTETTPEWTAPPRITLAPVTTLPPATTEEITTAEDLGRGLLFSSYGNGTCILVGLGSCTDACVVIPEYAPNGDRVVEIAARAFYGAASVSAIQIPAGITRIGSLAFGDCLFADGNEPIVTTADFNVVCTYSPIAAKWQIGVISYGESGALL